MIQGRTFSREAGFLNRRELSAAVWLLFDDLPPPWEYDVPKESVERSRISVAMEQENPTEKKCV